LSKKSENKFWYVKKNTKKPLNNLSQNCQLFEKPTGSFIQVGYRSWYTCKNIGSRKYNRIATDRRTGGYHPGIWQPHPSSWSNGHLKERKKQSGGEHNRPTLALTCPSYCTGVFTYYKKLLPTYLPTYPTQWPPHPIRPNTLFNAHPFSAPHLIRALDDHRVGAGAGLTGFRVELFYLVWLGWVLLNDLFIIPMPASP